MADGIEEGATLRLAVGRDNAAALHFIRKIITDVGGVPPGVSWQQAADAVRALAWLQYAAGAGVTPKRIRQHAAGDGPCTPSDGDGSCTRPEQKPPTERAPAEHTAIEGQLREARRYLRYAYGMYGWLILRGFGVLDVVPLARPLVTSGPEVTQIELLTAMTGVAAADVLVLEVTTGTYSPAHAVMLDHARREVVVVIRGSNDVHDFLTDLVCVHAAFDSALGAGIAHAGMLKAAQRLLPALTPTIDAALAAHVGYALVFTGHSLGAAIAALMALMVGPRWIVGGRPAERGCSATGCSTGRGAAASVHAFTFGVPALVNLELARAASGLVTSIVDGVDLCPRLGLATSIGLRESFVLLGADPGLLGRVAARREGQGSSGSVEPETSAADAAWASSILEWLEGEVRAILEARGLQHLYPPGQILWRPAAGDGSTATGAHRAWILAEQEEFDSFLLRGTEIVTDHLGYPKALFGGSSP